MAAVHVYVSDQGSNSVSVFSIGATGALSPVTCDPSTSRKTGTHPFGVAVCLGGFRAGYHGNGRGAGPYASTRLA